MSTVLNEDEQQVLESIEQENGTGKFVDSEFIKRKLGSSPYAGGMDGFGIVEELVKKEKVLKYTYADTSWYVANNKPSLQIISNKALAKEYEALRAAIANTSSSSQKNLLKMKQSVLDSIRNDIENKIKKLNVIDKDSSEAVLKQDKAGENIAELIKSLIKERTEKFLKSFSILDILDNQKLFSGELNVGSTSFADISQVLEALLSRKEILKMNSADNTELYFDKDSITTEFLQSFRERLRQTKQELDRKSLSPADVEYKRYIQLENIYNFLQKETEQQAENDTPRPSAAEPGNKPDVTEERAEQNQPEVAERAEDNDEIANEDYLTKDKLLAKIKFQSSRDLLKKYIEDLMQSEDKEKKIEAFKLLFSSISVLIKVPEKENYEIYELAKTLLNEVEEYIPEDIVMHQLMNLEKSYEKYSSKMAEKSYLENLKNKHQYNNK
ncbi:MAG TPA: hypothetical protein VKS21_06660 [Spirochaetota bacterium]|nr:hypothetical protein [Spirochaetota bacterium]